MGITEHFRRFFVALLRSDAYLSRRGLMSGMLALCSAAALGGCSRGSQGTSAGENIEGLLRVAMGRPAHLDPAYAREASELAVVAQVFEPLCSYDYVHDMLVCRAAESFEISDDARQLTFHLREATFHNGDAVRAADFRRAWERMLNPESNAVAMHGEAPYTYRLALIEGYEELRSGTASSLAGVSCPDDRTLVVRLARPYADYAYVLAHPALAPVPHDADEDPETFDTYPVGNGPYALEGPWSPKRTVLPLTAYEDYGAGESAIPRLRFLAYDDIAEAYADFLSGSVDVCACPVDEVENAQRLGVAEDGLTMDEGERLLVDTQLSCSYLVCNLTAPPFDNADVRRALSMAIDREALCRTVYRDLALPADDIVAPHVRGYRAGAWADTAYDAQRAADLAGALYPDEASKPHITCSYYSNGGHKGALEFIAKACQSLGFEFELEELDFDELHGRLAQGAFQLARLDAIADAPVMDSVIFPLFSSSCVGSTNYSGYANPEVDTLLEQARGTINVADRTAMLQEADDLVARELPVIPLTYAQRVVAGSDRIERLVVDPHGIAQVEGGALVDEDA